MITTYLNDIAVGDRRVSRARTITETDIVTFAMFTGDWHPIHTDVDYAADDPRFHQRIAHGALVLSVSLGLVEFWPPAMRAFYGVDRLRFVSPTFIGDTIHVLSEIVEIAPRGSTSGVVAADYRVQKADGLEVLVGTVRVLVDAAPE